MQIRLLLCKFYSFSILFGGEPFQHFQLKIIVVIIDFKKEFLDSV